MTDRLPETGTSNQPNDDARTSESISLTTESLTLRRRFSDERPSEPVDSEPRIIVTVSSTTHLTVDARTGAKPTAHVVAELPPLRVERLSVKEARETARQTAEAAEAARKFQLENEAAQGIDWNEIE